MYECVITYQLTIQVQQPVKIIVGKLGVLDLPKCTCVYTGSARKNMEARIGRHLRDNKKLRWHIDYLLVHPAVSVSQVDRYKTPECELNQSVSGIIALTGFGSSDCRAGCGSHLKIIG